MKVKTATRVGFDFVSLPLEVVDAHRQRQLRAIDFDILIALYRRRDWKTNRVRLTLEQLSIETCEGCWTDDNLRHRLAALRRKGWLSYSSPRGKHRPVYDIVLHPVRGAANPRPMSDPSGSASARPNTERTRPKAKSRGPQRTATSRTHQAEHRAGGAATHEAPVLTHEDRAASLRLEGGFASARPDADPSSQRNQRRPLSEEVRFHPSLLTDERANDGGRGLLEEDATDNDRFLAMIMQRADAKQLVDAVEPHVGPTLDDALREEGLFAIYVAPYVTEVVG